VQPQPPPEGADEEEPAVDFPFEGAAKTDSLMVCVALSHFGHVMTCDWLITMRS
jgi:hypothetical protein